MAAGDSTRGSDSIRDARNQISQYNSRWKIIRNNHNNA